MLSLFNLKNVVITLWALVLMSPITGELIRIPLAGFDFLPSDFFLLLLVSIWLIYKLKSDRVLRLGYVGKTLLGFLFFLVLNYLVNLYRFDLFEMKSAFFYMARLGLYFLYMPICFDLFHRYKNKILFAQIALFAFSFLTIILFGFLQLKYFPSFLELGLHLDGWDPHIGRLLSTWFDPNFIAGFIAFMLPLFISLAVFYFQEKKMRWIFTYSFISLIGTYALYLTFSRSGYLAFILALSTLALLKARKLFIVGLIAVILAFSLSSRVQQRTLEAFDSAKALISMDSQRPLDPTAELRVWSWKFAIEIIQDHPWLGVGYNRYPYEINQRGHGLPSDHASGGSDSSLLTIWATMGIFGLLSYLSIAFVATVISAKRLMQSNNYRSYTDAGLLAGFSGLMLHSVFVNSLLFAFMMVYIMSSLALLDDM